MKILIKNYSFSAVEKKVTFVDYASIDLEGILLITNVTSNIIIYNFANPAKGGSVVGNVLTLDFDTTAMSNTDELQIFYDDFVFPSRETTLSSISGKLNVELSTRATNETRDADGHPQSDVLTYPGPASGQFPTALTAGGNFRTAVSEPLPAGTNNIGDVDVVSTANPPNLDVALSTRATQATLSEIGSMVLHTSTTTALAAGASWTSAVDSTLNTGRITGSVFADQSGTIYIEQSPNNTNWDISDSFSVSANVGLGFSIEKVAEHIRVRYVNGATAQTVFRLYVYRRLRVR